MLKDVKHNFLCLSFSFNLHVKKKKKKKLEIWSQLTKQLGL